MMKRPTSNVRLVPTTTDDPLVRPILQEETVLVYLSEVHRYPEGMPTSLHFRIEWEEQVVGEVALKQIRWLNRKAEISLFLAPPYQGKGLGRQALQQLVDFAFNTLNLHRLEAEVVDFNPVAKRLFTRLGFKEEGRLREARFYQGQYYDILRFGLLRAEYRSEDA